MKVFIMLAFLSSLSTSFADDVLEKLKNLESEVHKNAEKHCSSGSQAACKAKEVLKDPTKAGGFQPPKNVSAEEMKALQELSLKMQVCGKDQTCLQKVAEEMQEKQINSLSIECNKGNKDSCFYKEHEEISKKMQDALSSLK